MMRRALLLCVLSAVPASALNLAGEWFSTGYKMPRQDLYPTAPGGGPVGACSTCTITRNWDGTTAKLFGARNETVGGMLYLLGGGADATSVMVKMSALTGPAGATIASVAVSSANVWNTTTRPIQLFKVDYLQILGISAAPYDPSEYEQRQAPQQMRRPCTVNVNNDCVPDGGTLYTDRPSHNKFLPDILVPMEFVASSSFTVAASSSQGVWIDIYVAADKPPGTYTGTLTVTEGVSVSSTIPVSLLVYNITMPDIHYMPVLVEMAGANVNGRMSGNRFPPVSCSTCTTTRNKVAMMFKAHGMAGTTGDVPDVNTNNYPSAEYRAHLDGSLYTSGNGYGNAVGVNTPDQFYMIGTYGSWANNPNWSSTNATLFCDQVSSWSVNMAAYPATDAAVYLSDELPDLTTTEKWSTWMTTSCAQSGKRLSSWATASLYKAAVQAPHLDIPVTAQTLQVSTTVWQTYVDAYLASPVRRVWRYNSSIPGGAGVFNLEDDGIAQQSLMWSDYKKRVQGHFLWEGTYWYDDNNGGAEPNGNATPVMTQARTFGYDNYPSTDPVKGHYGFQYTNSDGLLVYPGTDTVYPASSYGVDAPLASLRLKMFRRAIVDVDYLNMANQINPLLTDAVVNATVPTPVLYEVPCFSSSDCTYAYGPRSWSNDPNVWELARESLLQIATSSLPYKSYTQGASQFKGTGGLK